MNDDDQSIPRFEMRSARLLQRGEVGSQVSESANPKRVPQRLQKPVEHFPLAFDYLTGEPL